MENGSIVEKWNTTSKPLASETKKLNNDSESVKRGISARQHLEKSMYWRERFDILGLKL